MPPSLRPLRPADAAAVLALARSLPAWFNAEGLAAIERDVVRHRGFVAEEESLLGFVLWQPLEDGVADLSWMAVAESRHRRGLGTALLDAVVEAARREGHAFLEVSTLADSCPYEPYARTRAFYRARGFRDHRVDAGYYGSGAHRDDALVLRRALAGATE